MRDHYANLELMGYFQGNVYPEYTNVGAPQGKKPVFVDGNGVHGL